MMSVTLKRLPDEPIVIATITGEVNRESVLKVYQLTEPYLDQIEGTIYRITDVSAVTTNLAEMLRVIQSANTNHAASSSDPRLRVTLVGTTAWMRFFRDALEQQSNVQIAVFDNLDDALAAIRQEIARSSESV
jgi:hypothetical protein